MSSYPVFSAGLYTSLPPHPPTCQPPLPHNAPLSMSPHPLTSVSLHERMSPHPLTSVSLHERMSPHPLTSVSLHEQMAHHPLPSSCPPIPAPGPTWCYLPAVSSGLPAVMQVQPPPEAEVKAELNAGPPPEKESPEPELTPLDQAVFPAPPQTASGHVPSSYIMDPPLPLKDVDLTAMSEAGRIIASQVLAAEKKTKKPSKPKNTGSPGGSWQGCSTKRPRNPELWKKNITKQKKIRGEAHMSRNGTYIEAKRLEDVDCTMCSFQCNDKYSEETRAQLFEMFYSLGSNESQKQFVCQNVTEEATKQKVRREEPPDDEDGKVKQNKRRVTRRYYLPESDNTRTQVCSQFFRGTLAVGKSFICHALKNKKFGCYMGQEKRGKPHNKTPKVQLDLARAHIAKVLCLNLIDSHDAGKKKKTAKKQCMERGLTVAKMYHMFREEYDGQIEGVVSLGIYRKIFQDQF